MPPIDDLLLLVMLAYWMVRLAHAMVLFRRLWP